MLLYIQCDIFCRMVKQDRNIHVDETNKETENLIKTSFFNAYFPSGLDR